MTLQKTTIDPVESTSRTVVTMEDHDEAYYVWQKAGFRDRVLLHFDAHIDFEWNSFSPSVLLEKGSQREIHAELKQYPFWNLSPKPLQEQIHIGNYIRQAIREGIVRKFVWIYPDHPDPEKQSLAVKKILEALTQNSYGEFTAESSHLPGCFEGYVGGKPLTVIPFSKLPRISTSEPVLLDIDTDFFTVQSLHSSDYPSGEFENPVPWLLPRDFFTELQNQHFRFDSITIAYSVEGGYTPLALKFLGEELEMLFKGTGNPDSESKFKSLHTALALQKNGEIRPALQQLEAALRKAPGEASLNFNTAMICLKINAVDKAKQYYEQATGNDPSYRTPYNHPGPVYFQTNRLREARESYDLMEKVDPENPHYKLFRIGDAFGKKQWDQVISKGELLLNHSFDHSDLRLYLAQAYTRLKHYDRAWDHVLAIRPNECSYPVSGSLYLKASLAKKMGLRETALECYQHLLRHWIKTPQVHWNIAKLYFAKGNFYKTRKHLLETVRVFYMKPFYQLLNRLKRWRGRS
ncbi:MAG: UPF0489 family protein [Candidatus Omnitrophica bacterium]|nr:UPF0489 family protein [Candidatus Omnitrophota bacterium]